MVPNMLRRLAVLLLALPAACALPAAQPRLAAAYGTDDPHTGSLIGGADTGDSTIGRGGDPSFKQPDLGNGTSGTISHGFGLAGPPH